MDLPSRPEAPGLPQGLRGPGLRGREGAPSRARAEPGQAGGTASAPPSRGRSRALEGHSSLPRGLRGAQPGSVIPAPHHPGTALAVMPTAQGLSERLTGDRKPGTFRAQQRNPLWGVSPHPAAIPGSSHLPRLKEDSLGTGLRGKWGTDGPGGDKRSNCTNRFGGSRALVLPTPRFASARVWG